MKLTKFSIDVPGNLSLTCQSNGANHKPDALLQIERSWQAVVVTSGWLLELVAWRKLLEHVQEEAGKENNTEETEPRNWREDVGEVEEVDAGIGFLHQNLDACEVIVGQCEVHNFFPRSCHCQGAYYHISLLKTRTFIRLTWWDCLRHVVPVLQSN